MRHAFTVRGDTEIENDESMQRAENKKNHVYIYISCFHCSYTICVNIETESTQRVMGLMGNSTCERARAIMGIIITRMIMIMTIMVMKRVRSFTVFASSGSHT